MPNYGSYCPVAMATEVVADRWTPLIIRELMLGNTRFNDIARAMPGISRSLLTQRLRHLQKTRVLDVVPSPGGRGSEYHLTPAGRDLERVIDSMGRWAVEWLFDDLRPLDVPPTTLMWWMHRRIEPSRLPPRRTVVEFRHTAPKPQVIWLVLERSEASVCLKHPGYDSDVVVTASTPALANVFAGYSRWSEAVHRGEIEVAGISRLTSALPTWFLWSPWAEVTRERSQRAAAEPAAEGQSAAG